MKLSFQKPEIISKNGEVYIKFQSNNISAECGVFAKILKHCYIASFSNCVSISKDTNEPFYWVDVSLQYEHKNGGSNGMTLFSAWYSEDKGWEFRDVE